MSERTQAEVLLDAAGVFGRVRIALSHARQGREACTGVSGKPMSCDGVWSCDQIVTMLPSAGELRALQRELDRLALPYVKEES